MFHKKQSSIERKELDSRDYQKLVTQNQSTDLQEMNELDARLTAACRDYSDDGIVNSNL